MMRQVYRRLISAAFSVGVAFTMGATIACAEDADRFLGTTEAVQDKAPVLKYGVTVVHLQDDFWKGMAYGVADEVKRSGGEVVQISVAGNYGNVAEQFAQIDAMIAKGINVLILGPAAYDGFEPLIQKAKAKGIVVIAAGIPLNSKAADFGVVLDDYAIGKALGDKICQSRPKDKTNFKTLVLPGPAGAEWTRIRVTGFMDSAKNCEGEEVITAPVGGEISLGYGLATTADLITKNPDASFVWTPTMGLGMGAIQAVKQRNANIKVVGSTLLRAEFDEFESGDDILLGVNTEPAILMGRLMVQYAIRQKLGQPMPLLEKTDAFQYPVIKTPTTILTKESYKTYPYESTDLPPTDWSIQAVQ